MGIHSSLGLKVGLFLLVLSGGGAWAFAGSPGPATGRGANLAHSVPGASTTLHPGFPRVLAGVDPPVWLWQEVAETPPWEYGNFGNSVAVGDATALIANAFGTVYVFSESDGTWTQTQELTAADGNSSFGWSVAVHGDTAFIGAPGDTFSDPGAVYVFSESDGTWTQTQEFMPNVGNTNFGSSVAFDGATAVIGAVPLSGSGPGVAYVFTDSGGTWTQTQKLTPNDGGRDFGSAVALGGTTILVGEPRFNQDVLPGSVYVFSESNGNWTQTQELAAGDAEASDLFGDSVALDGATALVGAEGNNNCFGAAYVFGESGGNWTQTQRLTASHGETGDCFGSTVAIDGAIALVAAGSHNNNEGEAFIFGESGGSWTQTRKFSDPEGYGGDNFASSAALAGTTALLGAPYSGHLISGLAYFYGQSDLSLALSTPQSVGQGQSYVSQTIVTNSSSAVSPAVTAAVEVPAATTFVSAVATQGTCNELAGVVRCKFGSINGGAGTASANVTLKAIGGVGTTIDNQAGVTRATPAFTASAPTAITAGGGCPDGYTEYDGSLNSGEAARSPAYQAPLGEEDAVLTAPSGFQLYAVFHNGHFGRRVYRVPGKEVHRVGPRGLYLWLVRAGDAGGAYTLCLRHP